MTNWNDETPNFIYQENEAYPIPEKYNKQNHSPQVVVERIAESGAIAVKTYYEPGFDSTKPAFPVPSIQLMKELKEETHKNNLVLVAHGNSLEAHQFLGTANVDIIAHGLWNWETYRLEDTNEIPKEITRVLDVEIKNKIGYIPTLQVINGLRTLTDSEFLNNSELKNVLPQNLIDYYKENTNNMYASVFGDAPKPIIINNFNRISNQGKINLKYMNDYNGLILFGTDTPSSPTFGNPPGYNGYLEMIEMKNAGIPLRKILASATIENAKAFQLDHLYGTVEKGKKANLLLLDKNPLEDISAYNSILKVIIGGKIINRGNLSADKNEN
ncbi:amidohydrolase family protein [Winogradskyella sp.]|uniref:amidohydrolase family protein n=1 Tax=Winogradskyella sp. TaxID=1883156 RepID=UPI0025DB8411|nr:amidohydrolase family protein [Winogradskyella sp.]